jgi:DNA-binding transcriptional MerR regulator
MQIPDNKRYFRIGEVSRIVGVEPYVLRYWESEFSQIRPSRADSNQRTYQRKDLEIIIEIKTLLYQEKMTIKGAKQKLKEKISDDLPPKRDILKELKRELQDIINLLS